jgi:hypothetical protein
LQSTFIKLRESFKHKAEKAAGDELNGSKSDIEKALNDRIESEFWKLEPEISKELKLAAQAGVAMSVKDFDLSDTGMIEKVNVKALESAQKRAGQMVGKGTKNSITDTTREAIKKAVTKAFEENGTEQEAKDEIAKSLYNDGPDGVFSDYRAKLIARTEIANAQMDGQLGIWKASGLPLMLKWLAIGEEPCEFCEMNDDVTVEMGAPFPDGSFSTIDSHPNCNCICTAVLVADDEGN